MFEITANASLTGRKLHVTASGSTNAHGFEAETEVHAGLMTVRIKLTKPVKNDPSCPCSGCGCATPNPESGIDTYIDVPAGVQRVIVTVPLEGTIGDFTL